MPKSRVRKKPVYTPPPTTRSTAKKKVSPVWLVPLMLSCLLLGLAWIVLYYVTGGSPPGLSVLGAWNLLCGFGLIIIGVILSTQWR